MRGDGALGLAGTIVVIDIVYPIRDVLIARIRSKHEDVTNILLLDIRVKRRRESNESSPFDRKTRETCEALFRRGRHGACMRLPAGRSKLIVEAYSGSPCADKSVQASSPCLRKFEAVDQEDGQAEHREQDPALYHWVS